VVVGIALVTLLVMLLQSEHERCDRVRASWLEVRRLTFAVTSAYQRAKQKQNTPDADEYAETAQDLANELYSAVLLLYGKGSLRKEYMTKFTAAVKTLVLAGLVDVFPDVDYKAQQKLDGWALRFL